MKARLKAPTAIANSSFLRALLSCTLTLSILAGCDTLKTRPSQQPKPTTGGGPVVTQPTTPPSVGAPTIPPSPVTPPAPQQPSQQPQQQTFLNRELPKVGVILGPGGMKAFAHLGVLRELNRARIPIHAIVGLEWGAVMGGLYSVQGQINDAEWKAFKLRDSDLPGEGSFLSSKMNAQPISTLKGFLDTTFGNTLIEKSRIEFSCGANTVKADRALFYAKGSMKDAMTKCVPYPPYYVDNGGVYAAPFAVEDAAAWLKSRGANVIVLVNVLGQGELFDGKLAGEEPMEHLIWNEIRREMFRAKAPIVNWVINVNTAGHPVTDFNGRRSLMDAGVKSAADVVNKMVSQYGF